MSRATVSRVAAPGRLGQMLLSAVTFIIAGIWAFPLYWLLVTSFKTQREIVGSELTLWPRRFTFEAYTFILENTPIIVWYFNSFVIAISMTILIVGMSAACAYAISQLRFPGRSLLWALIIASFMMPYQALIVTQFNLVSSIGLINTYPGIILPQLILPVTVIVYKNFFDSVPKDFREAASLDGANHLHLLFKLYLPMNWGTTIALAIITFIGSWNAFLWPFLATTTEDMMPIAVGITKVQGSFVTNYSRVLAAAVLTGLPVVVIYMLLQRRVTEAITLSAGIK